VVHAACPRRTLQTHCAHDPCASQGCAWHARRCDNGKRMQGRRRAWRQSNKVLPPSPLCRWKAPAPMRVRRVTRRARTSPACRHSRPTPPWRPARAPSNWAHRCRALRTGLRNAGAAAQASAASSRPHRPVIQRMPACRLRGAAAGRLGARAVPPCAPPRRREPGHCPAALPMGPGAAPRARPRARALRSAPGAHAVSTRPWLRRRCRRARGDATPHSCPAAAARRPPRRSCRSPRTPARPPAHRSQPRHRQGAQ